SDAPHKCTSASRRARENLISIVALSSEDATRDASSNARRGLSESCAAVVRACATISRRDTPVSRGGLPASDLNESSVRYRAKIGAAEFAADASASIGLSEINDVWCRAVLRASLSSAGFVASCPSRAFPKTRSYAARTLAVCACSARLNFDRASTPVKLI